MTDWLRQSFHRLTSTFRRAEMDHELEAELAAHLDLAIEENLRRGMSAGGGGACSPTPWIRPSG